MKIEIKKIIKTIKRNIRKEKCEFVIKIIVIIILVVLIIITSFNAGKKFYYLKTTFLDNKKVECIGKIARWNFNAKINVQEDGIKDDENDEDEFEMVYNEDNF